MISEAKSEDLVMRFRPRGFGRFVGAAFLSVWLCGWAGAEALALFVIGYGIYWLVTGRPAFGSDQAIPLGPVLAVGCFLLVWLAFWTLGGIMAIRELLRSVWAEDRLILDRERLIRLHRLGPFVSTRRLPRSEIRRVFVQEFGGKPGSMVAQLGAGATELTDLGTPEERATAARQLRAALGLADESQPAWPAVVSQGWQETIGPRGETLLVPNLRTRRKQALVVSLIALVVWTVALLLAVQSLRQPNLWILGAVIGAGGAWLGRQALWLHRGRKEWRIEPGKLVFQRRFGADVTELMSARALELTESSDSEGDRSYELRAIELAPPPYNLRDRTGKVREHLQIDRAISDPTDPLCLGLWLSQRASVPFHNRVPDEAARQAERVRLREQLVRSGKFGRFVVRLVDRSNISRDDR
jgi:hypothetical protein